MTLHAVDDVPRLGYDVVVVGAGPVGAVTALALARTGAQVLLLEANPKAASRFAGEWLHPPGAAVLERLDVGPLPQCVEHPATEGFVVFPDDQSAPIPLPYGMGNPGLSCEHSELVDWLREAAAAHSRVDYVPHARMLSLTEEGVEFAIKGDASPRRVEATRIVGADGRASSVREAIGLGDNSRLVSYMAGILLEDVELPFEGYGHVFLGGPGPLLLYRIGARKVRATIDLPLQYDMLRRNPAWLWDTFSPLLPREVQPSFRRALETQRVNWAATRFRPRADYGNDRVALVGDAAGYYHPLTASGMTIGFLDAEALAESHSLQAFRARREEETLVAELLANAVYKVFVGDSESAAQVRAAMYDVWRHDETLRSRTTQILAGAVVNRSAFTQAFLRVATKAFALTVSETRSRRDWLRLGTKVNEFLPWLEWPVAGLSPTWSRKLWRQGSTALHPFNAQLNDVRQRMGISALPERSEALQEPPPGLGGPELADVVRRLRAAVDVAASEDSVSPEAARALRIALGDVDPIDGESNADGLAASSVADAVAGDTTHVNSAAGISAARRSTRALAADLRWRLRSSETLKVSERLTRLRGPVEELLRRQNAEVGLFATPGSADRLAFRRCPVRGWRLRSGETARALRVFDETFAAVEMLAEVHTRFPGLFAYEITRALQRTRSFLVASECAWRVRDTQHATDVEVQLVARAVLTLLASGCGSAHATVRRASMGLTRLASSGRQLGFETELVVVRALVACRVPALDVVKGAMRRLVETLSEDGTQLSASPELLLEAAQMCGEVERSDAHRPSYGRSARRSERAAKAVEEAAGVGVVTPEDWAFCQSSLERVSRTFSRPIEMLSGDLQRAVTVGYLLCRIADTIEDDATLDAAMRERLLSGFLKALRTGVADPACEAQYRTQAGASADAELTCEHARVLRVYAALPASMRQAIQPWVEEMSRGMMLYSVRPANVGDLTATHTQADLERYCYFVAGTVGHMLTDLFIAELGDTAGASVREALKRHAESFGVGLQFVNILKDVTDDWGRARSFIPVELCGAVGLDLKDLLNPSLRHLAHAAVAPLFVRARVLLEDALEYTLALPTEAEAIRLFCLLPLWMAARSLVVADGNDAMFTAGAPVKITRSEVEDLIMWCAEHVGDDNALRAEFARLWRPRQGDEAEPGSHVGDDAREPRRPVHHPLSGSTLN